MRFHGCHGAKCCVALLLTAIGIACDRRTTPPAASEPAQTTPARKLLIIGWDGMSENVVGPLLAAGRLPNLKRLVDRGVIGPLQTIAPTWSPVVWTSVITGRSPQQHGITGFRHAEPGQRGMVLMNSTQRVKPALWNILTHRGISSAFVGYWVTWPAEPIRGVMVSDRYVFNRQRIDKQENPGGDPGDIADQLQPASMHAELAGLVMQPQDVTAAQMSRFIIGPVNLHDNLKLHQPEDELRMCFAQSESHARIAEHLLRGVRPAVLNVHFQGSDIVSHYFWKYRAPADWAAKFGETVPGDLVKRLGGVIDAYYEYLDERLGRLLANIDDKTTVIILSDHGFVMTRRVGVPTISGDHPPQGKTTGMLVLSGSGIKPGVRLESAHVYDVLPTILALLDLPVARDLEGMVLNDALDRAPSESNRIDTYDDIPRSRGRTSGGTARDKAIEDRLKRLGYFAGDEPEPASAPSSAASSATQPAQP